MCLLLFSYNSTPDYRIIVAANRDEFLERPTAQLNWWGAERTILGGRDLRAGGTWLGVTRGGRFGALTNYREVRQPAAYKSRGEILSRYFTADGDSPGFLGDLAQEDNRYRGYNVILGDRSELYYFSNCGMSPARLDAGIYGLSNHLLDSSWPKVERGKAMFEQVLQEKSFTVEDLFAVLADTTQPPASRLPDTGVGYEWERILAPIFISSESYGTRSSAVLLIDQQGGVTFHERTFIPAGGEFVDIVVSFVMDGQ